MSAASWLGWVCGRYVPPQRTAGHLESWQRATCPVLMVLVSRSMKGERSRPLHLWLALPQDLSLVSGDPTWLHTNARTYTHTVYLFFLSLSLSLSLSHYRDHHHHHHYHHIVLCWLSLLQHNDVHVHVCMCASIPVPVSTSVSVSISVCVCVSSKLSEC